MQNCLGIKGGLTAGEYTWAYSRGAAICLHKYSYAIDYLLLLQITWCALQIIIINVVKIKMLVVTQEGQL